jgi:hypothetical protein
MMVVVGCMKNLGMRRCSGGFIGRGRCRVDEMRELGGKEIRNEEMGEEV